MKKVKAISKAVNIERLQAALKAAFTSTEFHTDEDCYGRYIMVSEDTRWQLLAYMDIWLEGYIAGVGVADSLDGSNPC